LFWQEEGEIKERIGQSIAVYEAALLEEVDHHSEVFHKLFQLLTQLPQLAPSCPVFILNHMLRILKLGKDR
jgi:hypothetical protein